MKDCLISEEDGKKFTALLDRHKQRITEQCDECRQLQRQLQAIDMPSSTDMTAEGKAKPSAANKAKLSLRMLLAEHLRTSETAHPTADQWFWGDLRCWGKPLLAPEAQQDLDNLMATEQALVVPHAPLHVRPLLSQKPVNKAKQVSDSAAFDRSRSIQVGDIVAVGVHWATSPVHKFNVGIVRQIPSGSQSSERAHFQCELLEE